MRNVRKARVNIPLEQLGDRQPDIVGEVVKALVKALASSDKGIGEAGLEIVVSTGDAERESKR